MSYKYQKDYQNRECNKDRRIVLSKEDQKAFLEEMKNPTPPNERLRRAFRLYNETAVPIQEE